MVENVFRIPVCIFLFRRSDTLPRIFEVLRKIKPAKVYLRSDEGRTDEEKKMLLKLEILP